MGYWLKEGVEREGRFTAVAITRTAPMPCGINRFRKNVHNAGFPFCWRSKGKLESPGDAQKRNVDIESQNEEVRYLFLPSMIFFFANRCCIH